MKKEKKFWNKVKMHPNFYKLLGLAEVENRYVVSVIKEVLRNTKVTYKLSILLNYFRLFLLAENIPCTTIKSLISDNLPLKEDDVRMIGAQLVLAVAHLHQNDIIHRNIIPETIVLDWKGRVRINDLSTCQVLLTKINQYIIC